MNRFFQFNDLYDKAEQFYERKLYLISLEYLNRALSFELPITITRLSKAFALRGLVRMQSNQNLASIVVFKNQLI